MIDLVQIQSQVIQVEVRKGFVRIALSVLTLGTLALPVQAQELEEGAERAGPLAGTTPPTFFSQDPTAHLSAPDSRASMRINPEAPGPFIGLADAYFRGDQEVAKLYAKQFVTYLSDLMFSVKDITKLIGEAMIEQGSIEESDWVGVEQYLDYELAQARNATNSPIKPSHEEALRRVKADPKGEVEIYYFFTLNSSYARKMAPDIERLWQLSKKDSRIKMVALTLGPTPKEWLQSYRNYTGLSLPIFNGEAVAKQLRVAFVPAIVVVSPNLKTAYVKTGQQTFQRLYEFVRSAQGESLELNKDAQLLLTAKIGKNEKAIKGASPLITVATKGSASEGVSKASYEESKEHNAKLEKF